ncbi:hypothetical protein JTB14_016593 [Gonioctena quinquepunctata]|nr:hypothetical protein JTB14_016593 [Gonioctena quinquepunctata]
MDQSKRRRITLKLKSANPLFEKWISEWKEKAKREGLQTEHSFSRALTSIRKCPIPLESGRECKILKGFGDKLCQMLDKKLKEHESSSRSEENILINNLSQPVSDIGCVKVGVPNEQNDLHPKQSHSVSSTEIHSSYVPEYRSGEYAILLALYKKHLNPNFSGYATKEDICGEAASYSDVSFSKRETGFKYTVWTAKRTVLVQNELISEKGKPTKFSLTARGLSLAKKLYEELSKVILIDENSDTVSVSDSRSPVQNFQKYETHFGMPQNNTNYCMQNLAQENNQNIYFDKDDDVVLIEDDVISTSARAKSIRTEGQNHQLKAGENLEEEQTHTKYPFSKLTMSHRNQSEISRTITQNTLNISPNLEDIGALESKELTGEKIISDEKIIQQKSHLSSRSTISVSSKTRSNENKLLSGENTTEKQKKTLSKQSSSNSIMSQKNSEDFFIFDAGSFDIILYVDTQETAGSSFEVQSDPLLAELSKLPVVCAYEVKHLNVGDYVWICRHRTTNKELVLPYVVERKRLDDFAHSIRDGRYHEQKFRLKRSGIQNVIYLIENHSQKHLGLPMTTLQQAATNTAIQSGFTVKVTSNLRHTAKYLSNFTRVLTNQFKDKVLMSCTKENLPICSVADDLVSFMTFEEFNQSSVKNKPMTVSDLFVKMLIQLKGMSVDRALAIVEVYPTPVLLQRAYSENPGDKGEKLLAQIEFGKYKKKIGPLLSKTVHQLFTSETF